MVKLGVAAIAIMWLTAAAAMYARQPFRYDQHTSCPKYIPSDSPLIAHAGGGLPNRIYVNDLEALNLAEKHGFRVVELDFRLVGKRIALGHEKPSEMTFDQLLQWLRNHPSIDVVTDAKTDNAATLAELVRVAGPMRTRFKPQIYSPSEYGEISKLGMQKPILTVYRIGPGWQDAANRLDLQFVTIPVERKAEAEGVKHPVYLNTVDDPMPGFGLYTNCLIPS